MATATSVDDVDEAAQHLSHRTECLCAAAQHVVVIAMMSTPARSAGLATLPPTVLTPRNRHAQVLQWAAGTTVER